MIVGSNGIKTDEYLSSCSSCFTENFDKEKKAFQN